MSCIRITDESDNTIILVVKLSLRSVKCGVSATATSVDAFITTLMSTNNQRAA